MYYVINHNRESGKEELKPTTRNPLGELEPYGDTLKLYAVKVYHPIKQERLPLIHVLAPSALDALSQAEALLDDMTISKRIEHETTIQLMSDVEHVPFLIRGWGKHKF